MRKAEDRESALGPTLVTEHVVGVRRRGLGRQTVVAAFIAALVLIPVIDGLLFYRYQSLLENPPSSELSPAVGTDEGAEDLSEEQRTPQAILVGAGDIADCSRTTDQATARLLDNIEGTVFTVGDHVY